MLNKLQLQILPELQLQNLDQPSAPKSVTVANIILSINISNSNKLNMF